MHTYLTYSPNCSLLANLFRSEFRWYISSRVGDSASRRWRRWAQDKMGSWWGAGTVGTDLGCAVQLPCWDSTQDGWDLAIPTFPRPPAIFPDDFGMRLVLSYSTTQRSLKIKIYGLKFYNLCSMKYIFQKYTLAYAVFHLHVFTGAWDKLCKVTCVNMFLRFIEFCSHDKDGLLALSL